MSTTKTKAVAVAAFVPLTSVLAGVRMLALPALAVLGWMELSKWRSVSPEARSGLAKAAELLVAFPINLVALGAARRWGFYAIVLVVARTLLGGPFGDDGGHPGRRRVDVIPRHARRGGYR